ncbi:MAG: adenylate kinase [Candidatus Bathyarchaeota archaeon]|nr:adenylate kinase [Candidatus Bathyarchaeota archaeon]
MRIVLLGPPGSGKGTRAHIISELYDLPVITTGDMLRASTAEGTECGKEAKSYMDKGELVPDNIVNGVVRERFQKPDLGKGFILDGYPRSKGQADALDQILDDNNIKLTHVILVVLDDSIIVERLSKRRSCPKCGEIYHLESKPPKKPGVCDICGAALIQRDDDKPDVIKHRLEVYAEQTKPLIKKYSDQGLIVETSGEVSMNELRDHLKELLG